MRKNFFDLDAYEDDDIVQEGTELGSLDFKFDDEVIQEEVSEPTTSTSAAPSDDDTVKDAIDKENNPEPTNTEDDSTSTTEEPVSTEDETTETDDTGSISTSGDFDDYADNDTTGDALETSVTPEGDDLKDFGNDTSDVQNEYDPKEIEILNKLIAAEAEAINDYFDASKDSHDNNARRLYSDIGHEERFHMEQLMFQKAQFTGEKYEPRDPEVKKEYEELLQMGMDDHTAAATALDKTALEDDGSIEEIDIEVLEHSVNNTLTMLRQNEILMEAAYYLYSKRAYNNIIEPYGIILEQYFQEEVVNTAQAPKEIKKLQNPIKLLLKGLKAAVNGLLSAADTIRSANERNRVKRHSRYEWFKKNGIAGLFASGVSFYFYNDRDAAFNMVVPVQYVDLLYRLTVDIGKQCGINVTPQGYHGTIKNPVKYNSIQDGIAKIKDLKLYKTKIVVNDNNKEALIDEFFGYSDQKVNAKVWNAEANKAIYESNNVYTKLEIFAAITKQYQEITNQVLTVMEGLQGNMNSIYYKNRNKYNECVANMKIIVNTYTQLIGACTADLSEMLRLDKEAINITRSRDAGNPLPEGAKDRRTSGSNGNNRIETQYAKTKK
jgi:rubrerythrin